MPRARWNHNIHHHDILLAAAPRHSRRALDVGCGEGIMARKLRWTIEHVTAIDVDRASLDLARARSIDLARARDGSFDRPPIEYIEGDFLTYGLEPGSFDFVVCVAALHHMDPGQALAKMAALLRPNGTLAVLGLARSAYPRDLPRDLLAVAFNRARRATNGWWESPAPHRNPPPHTYREIREIATDSLPNATIRRHLLWRYSIVWRRTAERSVS